MQIDPTEEQVLLALWGHLSSTGLLEGRDRRQIKCSQELKNLFSVESLSLSALRQRIAEHLSVCKPIQVEYNVTTTSTILSTRYDVVQHSTVLYSTIQYSTLQYSAIKYSTIQYNTIQYSTVQYSTVQYRVIKCYSVQ